MKHVDPEKCSLAWFKLADFVERREKERALGLYRLLTHAIDDRAFAAKLQGDILWAFKDSQAFNAYENAVTLFEKEDRLLEVLGIYEQLVSMDAKNITYLKSLCDLYRRLDRPEKIKDTLCSLIEAYLESGAVENALSRIQELDRMVGYESSRPMHQKVTCFLLKKRHPHEPTIEYHLSKSLSQGTFDLATDAFLSQIKTLDARYYDKACSMMGK